MTNFMNVAIPSKPAKIEETGTEGTYEITGLYPGYGHTLGNALRRMLLSSIPGAAITEIRIKGIAHEFTNITGIKEDALTMVLNIKKIRVGLNDDNSQTIKLKVKGKGKVTAKDFTLPSQVTIGNSETHIAEITDDKTELEIEAVVERGIGFRSREDAVNKVGVGVIILDAVFSPVIRASYEVEDMRVGNRTDFNLLRIYIETDGTITPGVALEHSIRTMLVQFEAMLGFKMANENTPSDMSAEIKNKSIDEINIPANVAATLEKSGIKTVAGLLKKGASGVKEVNGIGDKAFEEIVTALAHYGIVFKD